MGETAMSVSVKKNGWVDAVKGIATCSVLMIHSGANSLPGVVGNYSYEVGKNNLM